MMGCSYTCDAGASHGTYVCPCHFHMRACVRACVPGGEVASCRDALAE